MPFALSPLLAQIPLSAERYHGAPPWLSNSVFVGIIVLVLILVWTRRATKEISLVPKKPGGQNMAEGIIEMLFSTLEGIVGGHMIAKVFPLLATFFLFILTANWFALLPGVGTIGFVEPGEHLGAFRSAHHLETPLLRATNADLNMTLCMALLFMILWLYWTFSELGFIGFIKHTFGVKGGLKGILAVLLTPLFIFVGIIEIISIVFRPVSLSLRLFGNVYAGENLLHTMADLGHIIGAPNWLAFVMSFLVPIPFFFLEILVGILQALVFTLLCAVYIQLSTTHEEGHADGDAHAH